MAEAYLSLVKHPWSDSKALHISALLL